MARETNEQQNNKTYLLSLYIYIFHRLLKDFPQVFLVFSAIRGTSWISVKENHINIISEGAESHCSRASVAEPHLGHAHRQRLSKDIVGETWLKMLIPKKEAFEKNWPGIRCSRVVDFFLRTFVDLLWFRCFFLIVIFDDDDVGFFRYVRSLTFISRGWVFWLLGPSRQGPRWLSLWLYACLEVGSTRQNCVSWCLHQQFVDFPKLGGVKIVAD